MSSSVAVRILESEIASLTKQVSVARSTLATRSFSAEVSAEAISIAQVAFDMQRSNLRHMRGPAEVVSLEEYLKARISYVQAENDLAGAKVDLLIDDAEIARAKAFIESALRRVENCRAELASYGTVLQFSRKTAT